MQLLSKSHKFWTRVSVDSSDNHLIDAEKYIENIDSFHNFGSKSMLIGKVTEHMLHYSLGKGKFRDIWMSSRDLGDARLRVSQ